MQTPAPGHCRSRREAAGRVGCTDEVADSNRIEERRSSALTEEVPEPESIRLARSRLEEAENDLAAFPARPVTPFEIPEMLDLAFKKAAQAPNDLEQEPRSLRNRCFFSQELEPCFETLRAVVISVTDALPNEPDGPAVDPGAPAQSLPSTGFTRGEEERILPFGVRQRFCLVSNRPFLGNLKKVRTFHHVVGYLLQQPDLVDAFCNRVRSAPVAARAAAKMPGRAR